LIQSRCNGLRIQSGDRNPGGKGRNMGTVSAIATKRSAKKDSSVTPDKVVSESIVDRIHRELRNMAITFRFLPGERLNEAILAKELGVSRTPLREALNRLSAEGFLTFSVNQGFFRRPLDVKEIFDLYEFRQQMEMAAVRLAVERATDEQLLELERFAQSSAEDNANRTSEELILLDEEFHERLITLTGNIEMRSSLRNVNGRIQYVRWVDMNGRRSETQIQHKEIVRTLRERNTEKCMLLMGEHIGHRLDQIIEKVERCYGRIYVSAGRQI
jgi:DNA-binding GntR family transcriptional regulator